MAIEPLIELLTSGTERCKSDAVAALGNLAMNVKNRGIIGLKGGIPPLVQLLHEGTLLIRGRVCATLKHLSHLNSNIKRIGNCNVIPTLIQILKDEENDVKMRANVVECISYLSLNVTVDDGDILGHIWSIAFEVDRAQALVSGGVVSLLMQMITKYTDEDIVSNATTTICNLCRLEQTKVAIFAFVDSVSALTGIQVLVKALYGKSEATKLNAAGALGNLARRSTQSSTSKAQEEISQAGALLPLITLLGSTTSRSGRIMLASALYNLGVGHTANREYIIKNGSEVIIHVAEDEENFSSDRIRSLRDMLENMPPTFA